MVRFTLGLLVGILLGRYEWDWMAEQVKAIPPALKRAYAWVRAKLTKKK